MQVAHADQGPQQVLGADVGADHAGRNGPVEQPADRLCQTFERMGVQIRRTVNRELQRSHHAFLGRDELDIGAKPAPQCLERIGLLPQLLREIAELLHLTTVDRLEQGFARRKVTVERADPHAGTFRHRLQARFRAAGAEHRLRSLQQPFTIANGIGTGSAERRLGTICHETNVDHDSLGLNRIMLHLVV